MPSTPAIKVPIVGEDKTARAIRSAERNIKGLGKTAKAVFGAMGVGIGVSAITRLANDAIQFGSALTDAATATNTNVEALQALRYAAQEAGASEQQLDNALVRAQKSAVDASNGLSTMTRAFDALNIDVESFIRLPTEQKLEVIGKSMANADDKQRAYAAAMDILGTRNAPKLMEVLQKLGSEGFGAVAKQAEAAGQVMSEFDAQRLDAAADALARFGKQLTIVAGEAVVFFAEIIEGADKITARYESMAEAHRSSLTPAMQETLKAQDELNYTIKNGYDDEVVDLYREQLELKKAIVREEERQQQLTKQRMKDEAGILAHIAGMYKSPMAGKSAEDLLFADMLGMTKRGGTSASSAPKAASTAGPSFPGLSGSGSPSPFFQNTESARDYMDRRYHSGSLYKRTMEDRERAAGTLPGSGLGGAAETFKSSADTVADTVETMAETMENLASRMELVQQQIGNAR